MRTYSGSSCNSVSHQELLVRAITARTVLDRRRSLLEIRLEEEGARQGAFNRQPSLWVGEAHGDALPPVERLHPGHLQQAGRCMHGESLMRLWPCPEQVC